MPLAINLRGRAVAELKTQVLVSVQTMAASLSAVNLRQGPLLDSYARTYADPVIGVGGRVIIMDGLGYVLADSQGPVPPGENYYRSLQRPEVTTALGAPGPDGQPTQTAQATSLIRYSIDLNGDAMFAAAPILEFGQVIGAVRVTKNISFVESAVRAVTVGLVIVGAGGLLAGFLIAYALAGSLARPLTQLAGAAKRLGKGDLSTRAEEVGGSTEIEELGRSFNEMADRFERTVMSQREFVANASHQLRTPLTGMKLRLESATLEASDPRLRHQLAAAEREVDRLSEIVNRLLVMSKQIEEGEPTHVDLGAAASRAAERWGERADLAGAVVMATNPHGQAQAQAHPADVDQIFDNLIDNAITYAPGTIDVQTGEDNGRTFLAVRDHGPGIPGPELAHVTERFYRGKASPRGGTGLGLAIARDLAEKWGGSLSVESPEDGGTRVEVELRTSALGTKAKDPDV